MGQLVRGKNTLPNNISNDTKTEKTQIDKDGINLNAETHDFHLLIGLCHLASNQVCVIIKTSKVVIFYFEREMLPIYKWVG